MNFLEKLSESAKLWPDKIAIVDKNGEREVSYKKLESIVNQVSNVYDDAVFPKLYMKCFPEYSGDNESITSDVTDEETSMLSWYFMKKLKEL